MKCTPGTRFQFHLLNSRLIVYICVMRKFNKKKNALGVARLLSRLAAGRSAPPPTAGVSNYLLWHSGNFTLLFLKRWLDGGAASSSALKLEIREVVREKFRKILLCLNIYIVELPAWKDIVCWKRFEMPCLLSYLQKYYASRCYTQLAAQHLWDKPSIQYIQHVGRAQTQIYCPLQKNVLLLLFVFLVALHQGILWAVNSINLNYSKWRYWNAY